MHVDSEGVSLCHARLQNIPPDPINSNVNLISEYYKTIYQQNIQAKFCIVM